MNFLAMTHKACLLCALLPIILLAASCKPKTNYECRCYHAGVLTNSYEIGRVDREIVKDRCHAMQQQNGEDTCEAASLLK